MTVFRSAENVEIRQNLEVDVFYHHFPALPDFLRSSGPGTGPLSLVRIIEELLERESSGSGLENRY
jgi:hypothetical protein